MFLSRKQLTILIVVLLLLITAAVATTISQGISALLCCIHLLRIDAPYRVSLKLIGFDKKCLIRPYPPGHAPGNYGYARPAQGGKPTAKNNKSGEHKKDQKDRREDRRSGGKREERRGTSARDQKPANGKSGRPAPSGRSGKPQAASRSPKPKNNRRGK